MAGAKPVVFRSIDELERAVGDDLGASDWHEITQAQIQAFADATGDHQWVHVDVERAARSSFGATIAHGYLTLSMLSGFVEQIYEVRGLELVMNYGLQSVRFPTPVPVGSRIRAHARLLRLERRDSGVKMIMDVVVELEGSTKPACVAETVTWLVP